MAAFLDSMEASTTLNQQSGNTDALRNLTAGKALPIDISQTQAETYLKEYFDARKHTDDGKPVKIEVLLLPKSVTLSETLPQHLLCETPSDYLEALQAIDTETQNVLILVHSRPRINSDENLLYQEPMISTRLMESTFQRFNLAPSFTTMLRGEPVFTRHVSTAPRVLNTYPYNSPIDFCYALQLPFETEGSGIPLAWHDQPFTLSSYVKLDNHGLANFTFFVNAPEWSLEPLKSKWREGLAVAFRVSLPSLYEHFALISYTIEKMRSRLKRQEFQKLAIGDYRLETVMGDGEASLSTTVKKLYDVRSSMLFDKIAIQVLRHSVDSIYEVTSMSHQNGKVSQEANQSAADHILQLSFWHRNIIAHIRRLDDRMCDLLSRFEGTESAVMRMLSLRDSRALNHHTQEIAIIARNSERSGDEMQEMAKRMEKDARLMKFLAEVTAFFLPLTAVATIFSMDFFSVSENSQGIVPSLDKLKYSWLYWAFAMPILGFVGVSWFHKRFNIESKSSTAVEQTENPDSSMSTSTSQISDTKKRARQQWQQLKVVGMKMVHNYKDDPHESATIDAAKQYHDKALLLMQLSRDLERIEETGLDKDGILDQVESLISDEHLSTAD